MLYYCPRHTKYIGVYNFCLFCNNVLSCVSACKLFFLSDFSGTLLPRILKFGTNIEFELLFSKTCVRQPPLKLTLVVDVERWLSYKGTCHAKLHDMYLYKTDNFFHINHYLKSVSKVALLHRFYCIV